MTDPMTDPAGVDAPTSQTFTLAYGDCDAVGISYFALYYPWMERTYSTWLHAHGVASHVMPEQIGVQVVGVRSSCTYPASAYVFDRLRCELRLAAVGRTSYRVAYHFVREQDGVTVAVGEVVYVCRALDAEVAVPVPARLREILATLPADDPA